VATVKPRGIRFVKRVYPARALGLGLGLLAVGSVLLPMEPLPLVWVLLVYNGLIWPHLAYLIASRSPDPYTMERLQLQGDSISGGFWVAACGFNPLVSALITMMLWMNNIAAGGFRFFVRGVLCWLLGALIGVMLLGFNWNDSVSKTIVYACLPMLIIYPIIIGLIAYNLAMDLHRKKEQMQYLSRTDGLTGLFNRAYWELRAKEEIARARRNYTPLALVLVDVDHFKRVNDTYGHAQGDLVLQQLAQLLQRNLRETELLGRYGGEEFVVVLPGSTKQEAFKTAERLREAVAELKFGDQAGQALHCTISLGVAAFADGLGDFSSWLKAADKALYQAKRQGRNQTVVCGGAPVNRGAEQL
jgi:diguanylate cyclase